MLILTSCTKQKTYFQFEKDVMNEVFLSLVDSIYAEQDYFPPPPMPYPDIYFSTSDKKIKDSISNKYSSDYIKIISEFEKRTEKIKDDTNKKIIVVNDSVYELKDTDLSEFTSHFKNIEYKLNNENLYKIDLSIFENNEKYNFKYLSKFPKRSIIWKERFDFPLSAIVYFSKIQFDENGRFGVLTGSITYGKLNGHGVLIFIKKESNKWVIDEIKETWIS